MPGVWVSYAQLREELLISEVVKDCGFTLVGTGVQQKCECPVAECREPGQRSVSVNTAKGLWQCWHCKAKGNLIDFAAHAEELDPNDRQQFREAALMLQQRYQVVSKAPPPKEKRGTRKAAGKPPRPRRKVLVNEPLDFELKQLDAEHESVRALGLSPAAVEEFGLGFCSRRGLLQGRIAIPLHDAEGRLVGYAGRAVDASAVTDDDPLYRFPDRERERASDHTLLRFDPSKLLYNAHAISGPVKELIVVTDVEHVWHLHEAGDPCAVAVLDLTPGEQVEQIVSLLANKGVAWFLAGPEVRDLVFAVARERAVRWRLATSVSTVLEQWHAMA